MDSRRSCARTDRHKRPLRPGLETQAVDRGTRLDWINRLRGLGRPSVGVPSDLRSGASSCMLARETVRL
jgi:hypothetical protein